MPKFYRPLYILALITLVSIAATAQNLVNSRRSSYYTFIYKITNEQAHRLYKDMWYLENSFLSNLYDLYPTDSTYKKNLPLGHYVYVKTVAGDLSCELESVNNLDMKILDNHRDLVMLFHDSTGAELSSLDVRIKSKSIPFEKKTGTYRLRKSNRKGIVRVVYLGHVSYFEISRRFNNGFAIRTGKKFIQTFPINHILSPIPYINNSVRSVFTGGSVYPPGIYYRVRRIFKPKTYTGYIVFNKPEFKPGDTVRLKGFVTTKKGKPYKKEVEVHLYKGYRGTDSKKIRSIKPFRKGAYTFEFTLNDSLKLQLDNSYDVEFRSQKGHRLLSSGFRYEEYELKQNTYAVRSETLTNGKPSTLYLKGVDSNDMPLFDVRAEILLRPTVVKKYLKTAVFVPDTLWYHRTTLDPLGETKVTLPDSIMPSIDLEYEAVVSFLNSENERIQKVAPLLHEKTFSSKAGAKKRYFSYFKHRPDVTNAGKDQAGGF